VVIDDRIIYVTRNPQVMPITNVNSDLLPREPGEGDMLLV